MVSFDELSEEKRRLLRGESLPTAATELLHRLYWKGHGEGWIAGRKSVAFKWRVLCESFGFLIGFAVGGIVMTVAWLILYTLLVYR